jgi:hypothetical protein
MGKKRGEGKEKITGKWYRKKVGGKLRGKVT